MENELLNKAASTPLPFSIFILLIKILKVKYKLYLLNKDKNTIDPLRTLDSQAVNEELFNKCAVSDGKDEIQGYSFYNYLYLFYN